MTITLGDKVRSIGGVEGEVVAINADRISVMVKVPGCWQGPGVVSIPVTRLSPIMDFSADYLSPP